MSVLQALYDSEINFTISTFWDGGFTWKLGDESNGWKAGGNAPSWEAVAKELSDAACRHYPESAFAKERARDKTPEAPVRLDLKWDEKTIEDFFDGSPMSETLLAGETLRQMQERPWWKRVWSWRVDRRVMRKLRIIMGEESE